MKRTLELLIIIALLLAMVFLINYEKDNAAFNYLKYISMISAALFVPGYILANLTLNRPLKIPEALALGIGLSVAIVILSGVLVILAGLPISVQNIMNVIWFITVVLAAMGFFKADFKWINLEKGRKSKDRLFYINLILVLFVISNLIYLSILAPANEEFTELSWRLWKIDDLTIANKVDCNMERCTLSGFSKVSKFNLGSNEYSILFMDLNSPEKYDSICIDVNRNGTYCDAWEGPFWPSSSFFIDGEAFNFRLLTNDSILILNYPNTVRNESFSVSYNIKSYYSKTTDYDLYLVINGTAYSKRQIALEPNESMTVNENVTLPGNGTYKVEVYAYPDSTSDGVSISFFVTY
jgi:hypothetical protein